jgi:multiple sugar transport system permease protein
MKRFFSYFTYRDQMTPFFFSAPMIICIITYMFLPQVLTLVVSFSDYSLQKLNNPENLIRFMGFNNYRSLWDDARLLKTIGRTFVWMIGCLGFGVVLGIFYAIVMNFDIKGKSLIKAVILMPWVLPEVVTGYVMKWMFLSGQGIVWTFLERIGMISKDTALLSVPATAMFLVILANSWRAAPFVAIMVYGKLRTLPDSQIEAAKIDGASALQSFFYITIPWIWPIAKRCGLLLFIWSFNAYGIIYSMTNGGPANATMTLPIALRNMAFAQYQFGKGSAYGVIILISVSLGLAILKLLIVLIQFIIRGVKKR